MYFFGVNQRFLGCRLNLYRWVLTIEFALLHRRRTVGVQFLEVSKKNIQECNVREVLMMLGKPICRDDTALSEIEIIGEPKNKKNGGKIFINRNSNKSLEQIKFSNPCATMRIKS